jgi:hypothetical protein
MTPRLRKLALTAHVATSVGWLGAVVAYLALAITGLTSRDAQTVRAAYLAMDLIGWSVLVPLSISSLLTGLVQSLGTEWGLFRYYWILTKFLLTVGATVILLMHMPAVSRMAGVAAGTTLSGPDLREPRVQLVVHAVGGLFVLLSVTTLSVFKPWGRTRYGRRKQEERRQEAQTGPTTPPGTGPQGGNATVIGPIDRPEPNAIVSGPARSRLWLYLLLGVVGMLLLFFTLHLIGSPRHH